MADPRTLPRVLLADDDADTRELYAYVLRSGGFEVIDAADGAAALEQIAASAPDLVIADLLMPRADGAEVCRACKRNPERPIPVIIFTAMATHEALARVREAGADMILVKPLSPDRVVAEVHALVKRAGFTV